MTANQIEWSVSKNRNNILLLVLIKPNTIYKQNTKFEKPDDNNMLMLRLS